MPLSMIGSVILWGHPLFCGFFLYFFSMFCLCCFFLVIFSFLYCPDGSFTSTPS